MINTLGKVYGAVFPRRRGVVDSWTNGICSGWAIDPTKHLGIATISLVVDRKVMKTVQADLARPDLKKIGCSTINHGFSFQLPEEIFAGEETKCQVIIAPTTASPLVNGTFTYNEGDRLPSHLISKYSSQTLETLHADAQVIAADMVTSVTGQLPPEFDKCISYAINSDVPFKYVIRTCEEFRELGYGIILINSRPGAQHHDHLYEAFSDLRIYKKDIGRDFASWLTGHYYLGQRLENMKHIVFINDSIIGPFYPLRDLMKSWEKSGKDFWALSDSYDRTYHLQSSFFVLTSKALKSRPWKLFCATYSFPNDKLAVIAEGELGLSELLIRGGVSHSVLCHYVEVAAKWTEGVLKRNARFAKLNAEFYQIANTNIETAKNTARWYSDTISDIYSSVPRNPQHTFWDFLMTEFRYPFVKKELYLFNPENLPNLSLLMAHIDPTYKECAREIFFEIVDRLGEGRMAPPLEL